LSPDDVLQYHQLYVAGFCCYVVTYDINMQQNMASAAAEAEICIRDERFLLLLLVRSDLLIPRIGPTLAARETLANSAIHLSGVGKWVVIHVIRYMDYG